MKSPFKRRDPAEALVTARAALAAIESERAELQREREAKLVEADESEIVDLDKRIERLDRVARARLDQVHALEIAARRQEADLREQRRAVAINVIAPKLRKREDAAAGLVSAVMRVGELYAAVTADLGLRADWPSDWPSPRHVNWQVERLGYGVLALLLKRCPGLFDDDFIRLINQRTGFDNIAERVAAHDARLLTARREMPLPEPEPEPAPEPEPVADEEEAA